MKRLMKIFGLILLALVCKFIYENTSVYLYFNTSKSLEKRLNEGKYKDIEFQVALTSIEERSNHEYDGFLLTILKGKGHPEWTLCNKCGITLGEYANSILNKEYPGRSIPYLAYFSLAMQLKEYDGIYSFPISEDDRIQLIELLKSDANKSQVLEIIDKINKESVKRWENIIAQNK